MLTVSQRLFIFSYCPASEEAGGMHKKLGGDAARTADPNWPGYSIPYDIILNI